MRWQTEIKDTVGRHHRGPLFNAWAKPKGTGQQFSPLFTTWRCLATQPTPLARPHHARVGVDARVDRLLPTLAFGVVGLPFVPAAIKFQELLPCDCADGRLAERFACPRVVPTGFISSSTRDIYLTLRRCRVWSLWLLMEMKKFGKQALEGWKCERERSIFGE